MSDPITQTYRDVTPEYWASAYEAPPEYWPDACELSEPSRLCQPERNPAAADLDAFEAQRRQPAEEPVDIDMTIGAGEDPGWNRPRPARQWAGPGRTTARQET